MERIQRTVELARVQRAAEPAALAIGLHGEAGIPVVEGREARADVAEARSGDARVFDEVQHERHPATRLPIDLVRLRANRGVLPGDPGPAAQAYRMLRTQVLQRVRMHSVRALGVVSSVDGEGKSLTAVNLALGIAAESNQSVLLVDLDLRRPTITSLLGLPVEKGLESWFAGVASIGDICHGLEGIDRLEVVPTAAPVQGSSEVLARRRTQQMLLDLKTAQRSGLVIFDLPPVLLTDDFLTIAPLLDGVVLVACEGITRREDVARTREMLGPLRLLGTVLNRASESEKRAY